MPFFWQECADIYCLTYKCYIYIYIYEFLRAGLVLHHRKLNVYQNNSDSSCKSHCERIFLHTLLDNHDHKKSNGNKAHAAIAAIVVDNTHGVILLQITRGLEGLGLKDQGFIVTTDSNITWVGLKNNWAIRPGISEVTRALWFPRKITEHLNLWALSLPHYYLSLLPTWMHTFIHSSIRYKE